MPTGNPKKSQSLTAQQSLDLVLRYLEEHPTRYIFPITRGMKYPPCFKNNLALASNDEKQITEWARKYPGCNWGLSHAKSGMMVIDIDIKPAKGDKPAKTGDKTLAGLEIEYGDLPETEETRTPSGGRHLIFEGWAVEGVHEAHLFALGPNGLGADIDSPNYSIIPGCAFDDGTSYDFVRAGPTARAPEWFYDLILSKRKARFADAGEIAIELDKPENVKWAIDFLQNDAEPAIEGNSGDMQTVKIAMGVRDKGISPEKCFELMLEHYNDRCDPPWEPDDLQRKVTNAYNYASGSQAGGKTAEAEFFPDGLPEVSAEERAARLAETAERRAKRETVAKPETFESLMQNYVYVGQQERWVRESDALLWSVNAFNTYFANVAVPDKPPATPISKWLLAMRGASGVRRFDTFTYVPGRGRNVGGKYNFFVPSEIEAIAGDTTLWDAHLAYLFPDPTERGHVLNWLAWLVQNPGKKPKHALLIHGSKQGTGKSFIADVLVALIGKNNCTPADQDTLERNHNGWAMRTKLIVCEEIRSLGHYNSKAAKQLHQMITQERINIDEKNMPPFTLEPFLAGLFLMTNSWDAIRPDDSDRRYLVVSVDSMAVCQPKPVRYYCDLFDILESPTALAAILHQLMLRDLGDYNGAARAPETSAKVAMRDEASGEVEKWLLDNAEELIKPYSLVSIEGLFNKMPADLQRQRTARSELRRVLGSRFHGVAIESGIRPYGRRGEQFRVWAVGPNAEKIAKSAGLAKLWRDERAVLSEAADLLDFLDLGNDGDEPRVLN